MHSPLRPLQTNSNIDVSRTSRKLPQSPWKSHDPFGAAGAENIALSLDSTDSYARDDLEHKIQQIRIFNFDLERDNREKAAEIKNQRRRLEDAIADAAQSALEAREAAIMAESMSKLASPRLLRQVNSLLTQLKKKSERIRALEKTVSEQDAEIIKLKNDVAELQRPHTLDVNPHDATEKVNMIVEFNNLILAQEQTVVIF